ncbi:hypothetical protein C5S35_02710, partial [Candidatus Methanophagaceae archaeon]
THEPKGDMPGTVTIQAVYEALKSVEEKKATQEDLEVLLDSAEIRSNSKTMAALRRSDRDIKAGRVEEVTSVEDLLVELFMTKASSYRNAL